MARGVDQQLAGVRRRRYADALAKFVESVRSGWAPHNHWDAYTDLAKAQAEHKIAKEVEHRIARSAETSALSRWTRVTPKTSGEPTPATIC